MGDFSWLAEDIKIYHFGEKALQKKRMEIQKNKHPIFTQMSYSEKIVGEKKSDTKKKTVIH